MAIAAAPRNIVAAESPPDARIEVRRVVLAANHKSSRSVAGLADAVTALERAGIEVIDNRGDGPEHISDFIREHAGQADAVVLGGGDGTLNRAAEALLECGRPLGILPLGTANDLARTLQIPASPAQAIEVIRGGVLRRIDLGRVNGKHFFNVASIGLSVSVSRRLTKRAKSRWGVLSYPMGTFDAARTMRTFRATIDDGTETRQIRSIQLAVGNGRHYGGGMTVLEDATITDETLHLYSIEPQSRWRLLLLLPALRLGRLAAWNSVALLHGSEFRIETSRPMRINADGELVTRTPARFEVIPKALSVLVPADDGRAAP